jgi:hypothetical protein
VELVGDIDGMPAGGRGAGDEGSGRYAHSRGRYTKMEPLFSRP